MTGILQYTMNTSRISGMLATMFQTTASDKGSRSHPITEISMVAKKTHTRSRSLLVEPRFLISSSSPNYKDTVQLHEDKYRRKSIVIMCLPFTKSCSMTLVGSLDVEISLIFYNSKKHLTFWDPTYDYTHFFHLTVLKFT